MKIGYIRSSKPGPNAEHQRNVLVASGLEAEEGCGLLCTGSRDEAIARLQPGDLLVVASAACLGHPEFDVLAALEAVGARGASVLDAETGEILSWHPDAQRLLTFAARAGSENRKAIAAAARVARAASGNLGQKPVDWTPEMVSRLESLLDAGELTRQQMAERLGVSRSTLQRKLRQMQN